MNSLASLTSQPSVLRVEAKNEEGQLTGEMLEYQVYPFTIEDLGKLQAWIDRQFPDPFDIARNAIDKAKSTNNPFTYTQEQFLLKNAAELAMRPRNLIGTPEADALLGSSGACLEILMISIRKGDPTFDEDKSKQLIRSLTAMDILKVYQATQLNLVMSDPKAGKPDENPTPNSNGISASRRQRRATAAKKRRTGG